MIDQPGCARWREDNRSLGEPACADAVPDAGIAATSYPRPAPGTTPEACHRDGWASRTQNLRKCSAIPCFPTLQASAPACAGDTRRGVTAAEKTGHPGHLGSGAWPCLAPGRRFTLVREGGTARDRYPHAGQIKSVALAKGRAKRPTEPHGRVIRGHRLQHSSSRRKAGSILPAPPHGAAARSKRPTLFGSTSRQRFQRNGSRPAAG